MSHLLPKPRYALGSFSFVVPSLLSAVTILAFALRVIRLDLQPLWWDEGYSLFFATRDLGTLLERTAVDIHPPLYYILLKLWMAAFGYGPVAARLLSVFIGTATVPLVFVLARRWFGPAAGLLTALLLAVSPLHVYYSQEIRMYGLVTALGIISVLTFFELAGSTEQRWSKATDAIWVAFVLSTVAGLYTHYFGVLIVLLQVGLAVFMQSRRRPLGTEAGSIHFALPRSRLVEGWIAILLLYLPWLFFAGSKLYSYVTAKVPHEAYAPVDPIRFVAQHLIAFSIGHVSQIPVLGVFTFLFVLLLAIPFAQRVATSKSHYHPFYLHLAIGYLAIPLLIGFGINLVFPFHPIRYERTLLLALPAFLMLVACGTLALWTRIAALGAVAFLVVVLTGCASLVDLYSVPRYAQDDYRPLIRKMRELAQPEDVMLAVYPWQIGYMNAYYSGVPINIVEVESDRWLKDPREMKRNLDSILTTHSRVWLPEFQLLGHVIEDELRGFFHSADYAVVDDWYGSSRLELFAASPDPQPISRSASFQGGTVLSDWGYTRGPLTSGQDSILAWFDWQARESSNINLSLRLVDARGNVWAQQDRSIENERQRIGMPVPVGLPPGDYDLKLVVYDATDGRTRQTSDAQSFVDLGHVPVVSPAAPLLYAIPFPTQGEASDGIALAGFDPGSSPWKPGAPNLLVLFWQAFRPVSEECSIAVQLRDRFGNTVAAGAGRPAKGTYPPPLWKSLEIIRDPQVLSLPGSLPDGDYGLTAMWNCIPVGATPETPNKTRSFTVGSIVVVGRPHYYGRPSPAVPYSAQLGSVARLVGYDLVQRSKDIRVVLYWQAVSSSSVSYTGFAHLLDGGGNLVSQRDQIPGGGAFPTTSWVKDEYLVDAYDIPIAQDLVGDFSIEIGLYDLATASRLPVTINAKPVAGDSLVLPSVVSLR